MKKDAVAKASGTYVTTTL